MPCYRPLSLLALLLWLSACTSTVTTRPIAPDPVNAWQEHQQRLQAITHWQLMGRIAIQADNKGWHASIDWRQSPEKYQIQIRAPLGQGTIQLNGDEQRVTLTGNDQTTHSDIDVEALLARETGLQIPLRSLRYWLLGLPAPGSEQHQLDPYGRLSNLHQDGWETQFLDYVEHQGETLPRKISSENSAAKVKLIIQRWELPAPSGRENG